MRVNQLKGWPPSAYQSADVKDRFKPPHANRLQLQSVSLVPAIHRMDGPEVFLIWKCPETEKECSTRFRVKDASIAIRVVKVLKACRGRTITEIGGMELREEDSA